MSLVSSLGKVVVGMIVAKGVNKVMGGGSSSGSGGGLAGALGSLLGGNSSSQSQSGGLGGLGSLLGGNQSGGGLGDLLNSLGGGSQQGSSGGGLGGGLGDMLNNVFQEKPVEVTSEAEKQAEILLRAMISAAKSDGEIDTEEQKKIVEHLGEVTEDEVAFIQSEMKKPLDIQGLVNSVPEGMEQQVYLMSLLAINLDSKEEAVYLDKLADGLNISHEASNAIHEKLGAPKLYS